MYLAVNEAIAVRPGLSAAEDSRAIIPEAAFVEAVRCYLEHLDTLGASTDVFLPRSLPPSFRDIDLRALLNATDLFIRHASATIGDDDSRRLLMQQLSLVVDVC